MTAHMVKINNSSNGNGKLANFIRKNEAVSVGLALLLVIFLVIARPNFLEQVNLESLQTSIAPYGIMAIGMTVLLISGVFDLSVGSTMGLGGWGSASTLTI